MLDERNSEESLNSIEGGGDFEELVFNVGLGEVGVGGRGPSVRGGGVGEAESGEYGGIEDGKVEVKVGVRGFF